MKPNKNQLAELMAKVERLETRVDTIMRMRDVKDEDAKPDGVEASFIVMTMKQHAVLNLLLNGFDTDRITEIMGSGHEGAGNTTKTHIHTIKRKLGLEGERVTMREMLALVGPTYERLTPERYQRLAGIPKDWFKVAGTKQDRKANPKIYQEGKTWSSSNAAASST